MQRLVTGIYRLTPVEGASITIAANGTAFMVVGSLHGSDLTFEDRVPLRISPAMLNGEGSVNRVHIHLLFSGPTANADYTLTIADDAREVVDTIVRRFGVTEEAVLEAPILFQVRM